MYTKRHVERKILEINDILKSVDKNLSFSCKDDFSERGCLTLNINDKKKLNKINKESRRNKLRFSQFRYSSDKIHALELVEMLLKCLSDKPITEGNYRSGCGNKDTLIF